MTTPHDPYYDEDDQDSSNGNDMLLSSMDTTQGPPVFKAFKHIGNSFRNGGFCATKTKKEQKAKDFILNSPVTASDETKKEPAKSVTFSSEISSDLAAPDEPLIVPDEPEVGAQEKEDEQDDDSLEDFLPDTAEAEVSDDYVEKIEAKKVEKYNDEETNAAVNRKISSKAQTSLLITVIGIVAVTIYFQSEQIVSPSSIRDMLLKDSPISKLIIFIMAAMATSKFYMYEGNRAALFIEIIWTAFICSTIAAGIYFTYDLDW
eukprot:CAMPEP_0197257022 /NCGR_PEP_ID=MMETSP1429-20130617/77417_1 /TAXON_ID=49237 /ORGANISM="Chaetoceros  sp., Strain UNC1202" /LENGTH=260 /DNA_ID=CAMNT_0042720773 /DNA_START=56 /DNA_END=835 /DNA_ORIENTATION=-